MTNKYLIIDKRSQSWENLVKEAGIDMKSAYRSMSFSSKCLREVNRYLYLWLKIPLLSCWFNRDIKNSLAEYSMIIVFVQKSSYDILSYLSKHKSKGQRVIAWYWNPVYRVLNPTKVRHLDVELWSFDRSDCIKYNMKYNSTFYVYPPASKKKKEKLYKYDFLFLGANKGRMTFLRKFEKSLIEEGYSTCFYIVDEKEKRKKRLSKVPYETYSEWLKKSKCIVDVVQKKQSGLTLRVMESLFYKKKLITNFKEIINYQFYNESNVFLISSFEKLDKDKLRSFMRKSYEDEGEIYTDFFSLEKWIERFSQ